MSNTGDNTVSVIDGATCNAFKHSGCGQVPATVAVGTSSVPPGTERRHGHGLRRQRWRQQRVRHRRGHLQRRRPVRLRGHPAGLSRGQRAVRYRRQRPGQHGVRVQQSGRHPVGDERRDVRRADHRGLRRPGRHRGGGSRPQRCGGGHGHRHRLRRRRHRRRAAQRIRRRHRRRQPATGLSPRAAPRPRGS